MKSWLQEHFLPMWAKETVLKDNRELKRSVRRLKQENQCLKAYIRGLEKGNRVACAAIRELGGNP